MSIVRKVHDKNNPYIMLNKKALEINDLSWEAKGLWAYLLSKPDNWQVSVSHLQNNFPAGRDKIRKILNELMKHGLCKTIQQKENGKFKNLEYIIFESSDLPQPENLQPGPEMPGPEMPGPQIPPLINNDIYINKDNKEEGGKPPNPPSTSPPKSKNKNTIQEVTQEQKEAGIRNHGEELFNLAHEIVLEWLDEDPKRKTKRKSVYYNITKWGITAAKKKILEDQFLEEKQKQVEQMKERNNKYSSQGTNESFKNKVMKSFVDGRKYNEATCEIDAEGISFSRYPKIHGVMWNEWNAEEKFKNVLDSFGIPYSKQNHQEKEKKQDYDAGGAFRNLANEKRMVNR